MGLLRCAGHDLFGLFKRAGFLPTKRDSDLLTLLTEAIVWSGRYPFPLLHRSIGRPSFRFAKDPNKPLSVDSFDQLADFHREGFSTLFGKVFDAYPVPTSPWLLGDYPSDETIA
jgi:hypothetical protein